MAKGDRLAVKVNSGGPRDMGERRTLWAGMSGAGVFVGECLVGVITHDPTRFGRDRLTAVPISAAADELASVLVGAGQEVHLEPAPAIGGVSWIWPGGGGRWVGTPSGLLRARHSVVGFRGRGQELEAGERWCEGEGQAVRLLVGGAGMGKTRLALELCRKMSGRGWLAGLLEEPAREDVVGQATQQGQPCLLVVDYAETRGNLARLLEPVAQEGAVGSQVKVLLLARAAGDWWNELQSASTDLGEVLASTVPQELGAVDEETLGACRGVQRGGPGLRRGGGDAAEVADHAGLERRGVPGDPARAPGGAGRGGHGGGAGPWTRGATGGAGVERRAAAGGKVLEEERQRERAGSCRAGAGAGGDGGDADRSRG